MRLSSLLFVFFALAFPCFSQESEASHDSANFSGELIADSVIGEGSEAPVDLYVNYTALPDSSEVEAKSFDADLLEKLKRDPDMRYKQPPSVGESLWERILRWIIEFILRILDGAMNTSWGNVIVYALGVALMVVIIMMLLKVNAFRILYNAQGVSHRGGIEENIHEMNFDKLIDEAVAQNDYRRGVRLLFLYALKMLSDRHLIRWESGKTNHEYVSELQTQDLKSGLNELSFYFDYAWYGNFDITSETYHKAALIFSVWKEKIRS
ncbi:MAG TPA: DUF4129 domain-containing protein [Chryseosolibacter sp.]|nr:DUF4129 domain-containing protein [Chryseosolibacter sp.]